MKKLVVRILWIVVFLSFSTGSFAGESIRLASGEWPPFFSEELKHYGVISRIVTEAFALEGIKVEYVFLPWARSLKMTKNGEWDGTPGWMPTPEREKDFYISDIILEDKLVFFHLKSYSFDWKTMDDLKEIDIGATIGYFYSKEFEKAEKGGGLLIERIPTDEHNFRKLLKKRIKIFPVIEPVGYDILNSHFTSKEVQLVTHHPKPLAGSVQTLLLSKKSKRNKKMLKLFNRGLKRLKDSGEYDRYFEESRRGEYIIKK